MKYYTTNEVAKILNVNPETVRRWIRDGKLPCENGGVKGRTQRIAESDLLHFQKAGYGVITLLPDLTKKELIKELLDMRDRIDTILCLLE